MLGEKIRALRKSKALSISELSARVGVTDSYISQLERNVVDPSVSLLRRISLVLDTPIASFFDDIYEEPAMIRKADRTEIPSPIEGLLLEQLSPSPSLWGNKINALAFSLNPHADSDFLIHNAEVCIHVLTGTLMISLENHTYTLKKGDSITINANIPYRLYCTGSSKAAGFLCSTGILGKELPHDRTENKTTPSNEKNDTKRTG